MALLRCLAVPLRDLCEILGQAVTVFIHHPQVVLGTGEALVSRLTKDIHRLSGRLGQAIAPRIGDAHRTLCIGASLFRHAMAAVQGLHGALIPGLGRFRGIR